VSPIGGRAASTTGIGENVFDGAVAEPYLKKQGLSLKDLKDPSWVRDIAKADKIAAAVAAWALDRGATSWCHWFQPMAAAYRHGQSAQVQMSFMTFDSDGKPKFNFSGKQLLQSETDGSSYPNGGMRATHTAAAYLTVDPESPIFLRGDSFFVPALFVSFNGDALDEKTPLHRSVQAMSKAGVRLFKSMGLETEGIVNNIGLEQEIFLVPREAYFKRTDLQLTGRTVMGKQAPRGQEGSDHYMGPINTAGPAMFAMKEIQDECYKIGIPLVTRHREVAPNQYEFAPMFGPVVGQVDQNLMVMQIIEEVAAKHGLAALLQEKPFEGINGSGKHNNWSLMTKEGALLFNPTQLAAKTGSTLLTPVIMAAMVSAIDKYGDMMRMSIATPGNDFRLGGMEAPPAVISTYLGDDMTSYLEAFMEGNLKPYEPKTSQIDLGVDILPTLTAPAEDRNRTSPFPYGGSRFEFRACGSSQNVSLINTVLNTIIAEEMNLMAEAIEGGKSAQEAATEALKAHMKAVFNGNGYGADWLPEAEKRGLFVIPTQPDAIRRMTVAKNVEVFSKNGVFSAKECEARQEVLLEAYTGTVEMECLCMIDMINQEVIPAMKTAGFPVADLESGVKDLKAGLATVHDASDASAGADAANKLRLVTMAKVRTVCDEAEAVCPKGLWTIATYKELLFHDQCMGNMLYTA
jgi:glutamine synthetase